MIEWLISESWGRVGIRCWPGAVFLHCQIDRWSPSIRRQCAVKWEAFKDVLRGRGIGVVYSAVPADDAKVRKWQELFGLRLCLERAGVAVYSMET